MQLLIVPNNKYRISLLYLIIFISFSLAIFAPSMLGDPFWDDWVFIFKSYHHQMTSSSPLIFFPGGSEAKSWPVFFTILWGMLKIFKTKYIYYHLVNIIFHGIDGFLCWKVLSKLRVRNSFLITLLFLCHPLQLFTVSWIIQLKTILSIFFFLISLLLLLKFYNRNQIKYYFVSLLFFVLSLLTKSTTVAFGACLLLSYPLVKKKINLKKFVLLFILPFFLLSLAATLRTAWSFNVKEFLNREKIESAENARIQSYETIYNLIEHEHELKPGEVHFFQLNPRTKVILTSKLFIRYVLFIVFPLGGDYIFQEKTNLTFSSLEFLLILTGLSALYFLIHYLINRRLYLEFLGLVFFLASLLPFCGIFYIPIFTLSNFVPYWLSIPFLGLLPLISHFIKSKKVLIGIVLVFAAITHWQAYEFINVEEIFLESMAKSPDRRIYQIALIEHYTYTHQCQKAIDLYKEFKENEFSSAYCLEIKTTTCKPAEAE
jgi:hypothetical protein